VGFTLGLYARLPVENGPGPEREAAAAEIWQGLREIDGPRSAAFFAPEGRMQPESAFNARVFHGDDYFPEVTVSEEKKLYEVARRLTEMGLKERRPSPR
jgi:hypothetical protein